MAIAVAGRVLRARHLSRSRWRRRWQGHRWRRQEVVGNLHALGALHPGVHCEPCCPLASLRAAADRSYAVGGPVALPPQTPVVAAPPGEVIGPDDPPALAIHLLRLSARHGPPLQGRDMHRLGGGRRRIGRRRGRQLPAGAGILLPHLQQTKDGRRCGICWQAQGCHHGPHDIRAIAITIARLRRRAIPSQPRDFPQLREAVTF